MLEAAFGPPSQAGFGSAIFYDTLAPDAELEPAALDWALIVGSSLLSALFVAFSLTGLFGFVGGLGLLPFTLFLAAGIFYQARDRRMAAELQRLRLGSMTASLSSSPAMVTVTAAPLSAVLPGEWAAGEPPASEQPLQPKPVYVLLDGKPLTEEQRRRLNGPRIYVEYPVLPSPSPRTPDYADRLRAQTEAAEWQAFVFGVQCMY